ncbi:peptidoglycan recognition protein family protein [Egbenema bharatensis]|uniref:peptidoglycan recognition protein family protein n=1 Tax=Egbenema bharatensis TaxID=3463334 RepID=UPI003A86EB80
MKFNIRPTVQPTILRMLALALATLMAILAIGGIRAIARVHTVSDSEPAQVQSEETASTDAMPMNEWDISAPNAGSKSTRTETNSATESDSPAPTISADPSTVHPTAPAAYPQATLAVANYTPRQEAAPADPTNFGDRYATDIFGNALNNDWLIVLHETVGTADAAIRTFQTPHPNDDDQVSYHTLIRLDGTIVYIVPPEKRAYGAGNSAFMTANGLETVRTDPRFPPSVNNFAYHISLETPPTGYNDNYTHGGYTREQYQSLAWLIAKTPVPDDRITTHEAVDQSGSRMDPRSFDAQQFFTLLHAYPERAG